MTTAERGYGYEHRKLRERWRPRVERGDVACSRCGLPIEPGAAWDLAHDPADRSRWIGPQHAACNRNTVAERRQRKRRPHWRSLSW
jgi:hypothetical protein